MKHCNSHIQNGQKLHDKAVAKMLIFAYHKLCSLVRLPEVPSVEPTALEGVKRGRQLHDQEIGRMLKNIGTPSAPSLKPNSHVPQHIMH